MINEPPLNVRAAVRKIRAAAAPMITPIINLADFVTGFISFLIGASMGKAKAKGKRFTLTNKNDDSATGEDEKILAQKRKGRPQKPLTDDEDVEKIQEQEDAAAADDDENSISDVNEKKRKRNKGAKEKDNLVKKESPNGTQSNGFRHIGSRRKNKPHRAAEVGVECK